MNYRLDFKGKSKEEAYNLFSKEYFKNLRSLYTLINHKETRIYDLSGVAVIMDSDESSSNYFGDIKFIGTEELVDKTIKEIKSKGFSLEEIAN